LEAWRTAVFFLRRPASLAGLPSSDGMANEAPYRTFRLGTKVLDGLKRAGRERGATV